MRKYSMLLLVLLLALSLGFGAVACGGDETASGKTPQEAVSAAIDGAVQATTQSGSYEVQVTLNAEQTSDSSDPMMQAFLGQPFGFSGDFAFQTEPALADMSISAELGALSMGTAISAGIRVIDEAMFLNMLGQWYEVPAEQLGDVPSAGISTTLQQAWAAQGIDPTTWLKDLKVVGEEAIGDTNTTHLTATLDVQKMVQDFSTLMQSPELADLVDSGSAAGSEAGIEVPDPADVEELQATIEEMIQNATLDLWLAEDDSARRIKFSVDITVPAEMAGMGVSGASMVATIDLDAPGTAIDVQAPPSPKPFDQLEQDLQNNPLFSILGGLLGSGSGSLDGLLGQ